MLETCRHDIVYACRALARKPAFTALVTITLALGIGANSAIFTVVDSVLLKPLPYGDPEGLVTVWSKWVNFDKTWVSEAEVLDYREQSKTMASIAAWGTTNLALTGAGEPLSLRASAVSANVFEVFGVEPVAGRVFTPEEDVPAGPDVAMLDEGLWRQLYDADPGLLGETIQLNGTATTVVGVVPSSFRLPHEFKSRSRTLVWVPLGFDAANPSRGSHSYLAAARLAPGATPEQASRELGVITDRLNADGLYPPDMDFTAFAVPMTDEVAGELRTSLAVLFGAVAFLLLIACANVAALFLTRAEARQREIVVRSALGAGRGRLLRLMLTESVLLSTLGGVFGLLLATAGVKVLVALSPERLPRLDELTVDGRVLAFTMVLAIMTGLVFGTLPALRSSKPDLVSSLRDESRGASGGRGRQRSRAALVILEVAVALVLLMGAGLLIRSYAELQAIDPGFQADNVLAIDLSLPMASYPGDDEIIGFYDQLRDRVSALPGVENAAFVRALPLDTTIGDAGVVVEGRPMEANRQGLSGDWQVVSPGYFEVVGAELVHGRFFTDEDRADSLPIAAVNETMVKAFWPGEDPVGKRIRVGGQQSPWRVVVAVVGDLRHNGIDGEVKTKFYIPDAQFGQVFGSLRRGMTLVAKSTVDPLTLTGVVRAEVRRLDPDLPVVNVRTLESVLSASVSEPRFTMLLMGIFAALALALAAVGIYGVLSYTVGSRTREIGIRMALGAGVDGVRGMILRQGLVLAAVGTGLGILGAVGLTRLMASLLYGVTPLDALTFVVIPAALLMIALLAVYLPARRATRINPVTALRYE